MVLNRTETVEAVEFAAVDYLESTLRAFVRDDCVSCFGSGARCACGPDVMLEGLVILYAAWSRASLSSRNSFPLDETLVPVSAAAPPSKAQLCRVTIVPGNEIIVFLLF